MPGGRKGHSRPTPLIGGLGIFVGVLLMSTFIPESYTYFGALLFLSSLVLLLGLVDDAIDLSASSRMAGHALIALSMALVYGVKLETLGHLMGDFEIELGMLAIPVTVFATVGIINAINMSDGVDGLAGSLVIVALGFIALLTFGNGLLAKASFIAIVICAIAGFLSLNFRRPWKGNALVYLGDAGSTMLGFMLVWFLIDGSQGETAIFPPVYALWFTAVPLFDTINLLIKRPLRGCSPFSPGTDHLHHHLLRRGYSVGAVVFLLTVAAVAIGGMGWLGWYFNVSESLMFFLFLGLFAVYFTLCDKIKPAASEQYPLYQSN